MRFFRTMTAGLGALFAMHHSTLAAQELKSVGEAVNMAGKQRMYTQRMLKDYAMIGMHNTFGNPEGDLKRVTASFEEHLQALEAYAKEAEIKESLQEVRRIWSETKPILEATPKVSEASKLQEKLDALLKASDDATKRIAERSGKKEAEIVNIAGRQRMLSQRMASLYMLKVWGIDDPKFKEKLDKAMKAFKTSHERLKKAPQNDEEIRKRLKKVERAFFFFEMMNRSKSKYVPSLIYKKSNDILKTMDEVTFNEAGNEITILKYRKQT